MAKTIKRTKIEALRKDYIKNYILTSLKYSKNEIVQNFFITEFRKADVLFWKKWSELEEQKEKQKEKQDS